jgi:hypothetical protein
VVIDTAIAEQRCMIDQRGGYRVAVEPSTGRDGSNTVVLQGRPRDAYTRPAELTESLVAAA